MATKQPKPLSARAQAELDEFKRRVRDGAHDALRAMMDYLFEQHGECSDEACPQAFFPTAEVVPLQGGRPVRRRHLLHAPVDSQLVEDAVMIAVRRFIAADTKVKP